MTHFLPSTFRGFALFYAPFLAFFAVSALTSLRAVYAVNRWERHLGWNNAYGPRYVVFSGGDSDGEVIVLGTCRYDQQNPAPPASDPPMAPFESFNSVTLYEKSTQNAVPAFDRSPLLEALNTLPFHVVPALGRYPTEMVSLPFTEVKNATRLERACAAILTILISEYASRRASSGLTGELLQESTTEGSQLISLAVTLFEMKEAAASMVDADARIALLQLVKKFHEIVLAMQQQSAKKYTLWLEASNSWGNEAEGDAEGDLKSSVYVGDMEKELWTSVLNTLESLNVPEGSPIESLLADRNMFLDCEHFAFSRKIFLPSKESFCDSAVLGAVFRLLRITEELVSTSAGEGEKMQIARDVSTLVNLFEKHRANGHEYFKVSTEGASTFTLRVTQAVKE